MKKRTKEIFKRVMELNNELIALSSEINVLATQESKLEEQTDDIAVLRKAHELLDETRKKFSRSEEDVTKRVVLKWTMQGTGNPIRTNHVTGTPTQVRIPRLPSAKHDMDNWLLLCEDLGIPEDQAKQDSFRIHWPNFVTMLEERAAEGLPPPRGLDEGSGFTKFGIKLKKVKEILED